MVCCISLSLHALFISTLPLGRPSAFIPPWTLRFYNRFMTIWCSHIFPILNQSLLISSCRGKQRNIPSVIDHLCILIFFFYQSQISFCRKVQNHQRDSSKWCGLYAVWKRCNLLRIPAAAASCCSCHSALVPTCRAAKGITPTLQHVGLTLMLRLAPWKSHGCLSAPRGGVQMCVQIMHIRVAANI